MDIYNIDYNIGYRSYRLLGFSQIEILGGRNLIPKVIGLFKNLSDDEDLIFESKIVTPIVFVKEAIIKKLVGRERNEIPISYAMSNVYLTNNRLIFLILYQIEAKTIAENIPPRLSGVSGTWFEIPTSAILETEVRPLSLRRDDMQRLSEWIPTLDISRAPTVEVIYEEKMAIGRVKDYMESMLKMGFFTKLFKKVERVYDKLFIIGEETVSVVPTLKGISAKPKIIMESERFCRYYGTSISADTKFCPKCGKSQK